MNIQKFQIVSEVCYEVLTIWLFSRGNKLLGILQVCIFQKCKICLKCLQHKAGIEI